MYTVHSSVWPWFNTRPLADTGMWFSSPPNLYQIQILTLAPWFRGDRDSTWQFSIIIISFSVIYWTNQSKAYASKLFCDWLTILQTAVWVIIGTSQLRKSKLPNNNLINPYLFGNMFRYRLCHRMFWLSHQFSSQLVGSTCPAQPRCS